MGTPLIGETGEPRANLSKCALDWLWVVKYGSRYLSQSTCRDTKSVGKVASGSMAPRQRIVNRLTDTFFHVGCCKHIVTMTLHHCGGLQSALFLLKNQLLLLIGRISVARRWCADMVTLDLVQEEALPSAWVCQALSILPHGRHWYHYYIVHLLIWIYSSP